MYDDLFDNDDNRDETSGIERWGLGEHAEDSLSDDDLDRFNDLMNQAEGIAPGMSDLIEQTREAARGLQIRGFECLQCGLHHGHSEEKHDITGSVEGHNAGLGVREEFAEILWSQNNCHCAVHETLMVMDYAEHFNQDMFEDVEVGTQAWERRYDRVQGASQAAKVPDHVHRKVEELRQELESLIN